MEKKSLLSANWLKAAFLLVVLCLSGVAAKANTTQTVDLDYLVPGQTYTIDANTTVTGRYFANYDGTITLTSSVDANTNFVPFTDNTYTEVIETVRDEAAKTKTFVFSAGNRGTTVYFKSVVSTTPYEVTFDYVRASNLEDYVASIVPEDGSEVSSLKDFTINFTTKIYGARNSAKLYKGETLVAEKTLENKMNVNTYSFSFDEEITEAGDYTLVFPEESFVCGSGMKGSSEWKFYYTVKPAAPAITATWSIEEGAVIDSFESVSLTFTGVEKAASKSMYPYAFYKVEDDGTAVLVPNYCSDGVMDASASGTTITYSIDRECYVNLYGGNYRIVIPAGMVKFNGDNENLNTEEYVLNFTLNAPAPPTEIDAAFTADPANNSTVSEIREIILSFPDYSSIELAELDMMMGTNIPQAFMEDDLTGSYMPAGYVFFEAAAASNALRLYVPVEFMGVDAYTTEGNYKIVIPAGVVKFADGVSKEITLYYTVKAAAPAITATWSIEEGAVIDSFESVSLTFTGVESAASKSMYPYAFYKVEDDGTAVLVPNYCSDGVMDASASGTTITYSIDRECYVNLYGGKYRIVIPAGSVKFNGDNENLNTEEYVLNFTLNAPAAPTEIDAAFTADPANNSTVSEIREIILSFPDYSSIELAELDMMMGTNIPQAFMEDELTGSYMPAGYVFFEAAAVSNALRLYVPVEFMGVDAYTAEGNYKIVIPAGVVKFADGISKEISLYYTVKAEDTPEYGALPISISPASGSTVKELQTIIFEFSASDYPNSMDYDYSKTPILYNEAGEAVAEGHYGYADAATYMSLYVSFDEAITAEGVYTLKIPAGAMREYGWGIANPMQCPAMDLTYTVSNAEPQYTIAVSPTPSENAALKDLAQFTVTFDGVQKIDFSTEAWYAYVHRLDESGNPVEDFGTECVKISETAYTATLTGTPTELGTYRLTIPAGAIIVLDNEGVSGPNKEATFDYVVTRTGYGALPISISPADGSTLKELQTVVFEFSSADYPNSMDYDSSKTPVLYNEAGEEVTIGHFGFADAATYMSLNVILEQTITEEGVYTLKIPAGAMREYGWGIANPMECPALELTYTISNVEPQYTLSVTPSTEENVTLNDITQFTITFDGVQKIDLTSATCGTTCGSPWFAYLQRLDENGNPVEDFGTECVKISDVAYTATIIGTPTEEGTYRLTIPEGAITILDNAGVSGPVKEATFDYNVKSVSVEDILAEATSFDIYTVNGVCVLRKATVEDLKLLEPGIYIINGRKVVIR